MSNPVWPVDLPAAPLWGYTEVPSEMVLRSQAPAVKTRQMYTAPVKSYQVTTILDTDQWQSFLIFWETGIGNGALPFDWVRFDDTETEATYVPLGQYVHSHLSGGTAQRHRVSLFLEMVS